MGAKILGTLISCTMFSFLVAVTMSFHIYMSAEERINDICYDYAETVSTMGTFSEEVYGMFLESISDYGEFRVEMKLKTVTEDGYEDVFYSENDIIGRILEKGDTLTIAVYCETPSLAEKLTGKIMRCSAVKTAYIS